MSSAVLFQLVSWVASVSFLAWLIIDSVRKRHVTPLLAMSIGMFSICWMEAPFDFSTWCQFNPELPRIPAWGPLGMTAGGLPWIAPVGYVMFCAIPIAIIVWLAPKVSARRGTNHVRTLLVVGFAVGFVWDAIFEQVGNRMGWWRYARGYDGLTLYAGTPYLLTLTVPIFMGTLFAVCAYLVGRVDDKGHTMLQNWGIARSAERPGPWLILSTVVVTQLIFIVLFVPNAIAKWTNIAGTKSSLPLWPGLAPQSGTAPSQLAGVGGFILAAALLGLLALATIAILRLDPLARSAPPSKGGQASPAINHRQRTPVITP